MIRLTISEYVRGFVEASDFYKFKTDENGEYHLSKKQKDQVLHFIRIRMK